MSKMNYGKRFSNPSARGPGYNSQAGQHTFNPQLSGGGSSSYTPKAWRVEMRKCPPQPKNMTRQEYIEWLKNRT